MILWTDHDFGGRGSFSLRDIPWQKYRQLHTPPAPERMKDSGQKGSEQHITECPIGVSHLLSSTWTILLMTMQALFTSNTHSQWVPLDHFIQSSITSPLQCFLATSLVYFFPHTALIWSTRLFINSVSTVCPLYTRLKFIWSHEDSCMYCSLISVWGAPDV